MAIDNKKLINSIMGLPNAPDSVSGESPLTPEELNPQEFKPEQTPFEESQLGQWYNSQPSDDRTATQRAQDNVNQSIKDVMPQSEQAQDIKSKELSSAPQYDSDVMKKLGLQRDNYVMAPDANSMLGLPSNLKGILDTDNSTETPTSQPSSGLAAKIKQLAQLRSSKNTNTSTDVQPTSNQKSNNLDDKEMLDAQAQARENRGNALFLDAIGKMGTAVANLGASKGGTIDNNFKGTTDKLTELADQPIKDLAAKREQYIQMMKNKELRDAYDPNSQVSKQYKDFYKQLYHQDPPADATANSLEKLTPWMEKLEARREANETRKLQYAQLALARGQKTTEAEEKLWGKLGDSMDLTALRTRDVGGKQLDLGLRAKHALDAIANVKDLNSIPPEIAKDVAYSLAYTLKGSTLSDSDIKSLTSDTLAGKMSKGLSTILNRPVPGNQAEFLKMYGKMLQQQQSTAYDFLQHKIKQKEVGMRSLINKDPERWNMMKNDFLSELEPTQVQGFGNNTGLKTVTLADGNVIKVKPQDLSKIDKKDIAKVE